jgi:hypothetical protein
MANSGYVNGVPVEKIELYRVVLLTGILQKLIVTWPDV